jgi:type VI secretion system ImpH/TssG family protein
MAAENGEPQEHLSFLRRASSTIDRFGLFALLRGAEARAPHLPRIGASRVPVRNVVDLAHTPTLAFPPTTLDAITFERGRAKVTGFWFGLTGPMGPLPLHLTEFAHYEKLYAKERPFGGFLDLIAGRMLQFFYRAWAETNPAAQVDRPDDDNFAMYIAALTAGAEGSRVKSHLPARARLHYASLFASRRSASSIESALSNLLRAPIRLMEFQPRWREIEASDQSRLGVAYASLGGDAVLGRRVFGVSDAFRIVVRAATFREYEDFLPTGRRFKVAAEALDAFSPSHLEWDLALELPQTEARPLALDGRGRLGWTGFLAPPKQTKLRVDAHLGPSARRIAREDRGDRRHDLA